MNRAYGCFVLLLAFGGMAEGEPLPAELRALESLSASHETMVDAARRLDLQQQALIEWDRTLIGEYGRAAKQDLVEEKQADVLRRIDLIVKGWEIVLGYYPNSSRANTYYGEALYDYRGMQAEAIQSWKLALQLNEDMSAAHNDLGLHYMHVGDYDRGLSHMGRALKLEPKNPDYLYNMSQMYLVYFPEFERKYKMDRKKIYHEAMRLSRTAAELAPEDYSIVMDYAVNFYAAENFGEQADWRKAAEAWQKARAQARGPDDVYHSLLNEARSWVRAEEWGKAATLFEESLKIHPDSDLVKGLLEDARKKAAL